MPASVMRPSLEASVASDVMESSSLESSISAAVSRAERLLASSSVCYTYQHQACDCRGFSCSLQSCLRHRCDLDHRRRLQRESHGCRGRIRLHTRGMTALSL